MNQFNSNPLPFTARSRDLQSLQAANDAFYRALERRNLDEMGCVWSRGTDVLCVHPGRSVLKGWEKIETSWQKIFKNVSYMEIEVEPLSCQLNGCFGYVVVIESILQMSGRKRFQSQSIATNLFEHMGGRWHLIHHHGSPLLR